MNSPFSSLGKSKLPAFLVLFGATTMTSMAQVDRITQWRTEIHLQDKAERVVRERRFTEGFLQHQIDELGKKKSLLEDEMTYVELKFQGAVRQLKAAREVSATADIQDRLVREADAWDVRRKSVENDQKKVDEDIKRMVESLPKMLTS